MAYTRIKVHLIFGVDSFFNAKCAADVVDKWCCSGRPLRRPSWSAEMRAGVRSCILCFESNVSACSKDNEMLACREERQVQNTTVGGRETEDVPDQ